MNAHYSRHRTLRNVGQVLRSREGFSLVELAVYIVLLGIVSAIVAAAVMTSFRAEQTVSATTNMANDSQTVIANLDRDIRNSRSVVPTAGVTQELILCVASPTDELSWRRVVWNFSNNEITRSINGGTPTNLLYHPHESGTFEINADKVAYSFTLAETGTASLTFSGTSTLSPAWQSEATCP